MSRLTRDGTAESVSRDQILKHARGQGNIIFPVQLTTSRIGNLTRLIHSLLYVMTIHTYIHTYIHTMWPRGAGGGTNEHPRNATLRHATDDPIATRIPIGLFFVGGGGVAQIYSSGPSRELGGGAVTVFGGNIADNVAVELGGAFAAWGSPTLVTVKGGTFRNNSGQ